VEQSTLAERFLLGWTLVEFTPAFMHTGLVRHESTRFTQR
jgi:hypothetical protein